ncbi:hypothetical protein A9995_04300 [Erythrobacter sp. QSSC1-22B]|uniref:GntR family transcriptional regulator n=1 Tax=Erythrobacter sp. QSSC1-22B TaxID=1860125 RepID=UPI000804A95E|nr:GntR family transcriptional regulator [Erythrobacter sp. QSSC1-22B]OBX19788.1 hypothetical protein A9995_04300 [Erythrobacter sp. QSSC1-22B]
MSPAHVLEPTYRRLKQALLDGAWPAGSKLEAMRLAEDFGVSMTPVRDCLNQLVGEGLVDLTPGEGFRVPRMTEQELRDILNVNAALLEMAINLDCRSLIPTSAFPTGNEYSDRVAMAFSSLAAGTGNGFLVKLVQRISERVHRVRSHEPEVLGEAEQVLAQIETSLRGSRGNRHEAFRHYHLQCLEKVSQLIRCLSE